MGLEGAVKLGYRKELEAESNEDKKEKLAKKLVDELYEKGKAINAASLFEFDTVLDPIESRDWISMVVESPAVNSIKTAKNRYIDSGNFKSIVKEKRMNRNDQELIAPLEKHKFNTDNLINWMERK